MTYFHEDADWAAIDTDPTLTEHIGELALIVCAGVILGISWLITRIWRVQ